jgi:phosphoribosylaminoimidazolecarboxamide formyltransferase/IMP cyclohydrolase
VVNTLDAAAAFCLASRRVTTTALAPQQEADDLEVLKVRRAIVSVNEKLGVTSLARGLREHGVEIYSTGGTRRSLADAGVPATEVAEYTGFPEMLDGRVKTLHPKVHGGILARRDNAEHMRALETHQIRPFDMIVVNLYPFEQTVARPGCSFDDAIENIDIGGPSMIRSAAKNHASVAVVTDPSQYAGVLDELRDHGGIRAETRRRLALDAFRLTAHYDRAIARYLEQQQSSEAFPEELVLDFRRKEILRYGENPHQRAAFYVERGVSGAVLATARQVHGKELSYNNLLDLESALTAVKEFSDAAAVVIKHNNPCGVATASTLHDAFLRAYEGDTVSAFGCVLGLNRTVDEPTAAALTEPGRFIEAIVAPGFDEAAVRLITTRPSWKSSVRLLEVGTWDEAGGGSVAWEYRRVGGGLLVQSTDSGPDSEAEWKVVTQRRPTEKELDDLRFAWKVAKHVKSNAIVLAKDRMVVGVGAGQMNRVESVAIATRKAGDRARGAVLAGDAFFPFRDGPDQAAAAGVTAIIEPGGSRRDDEAIASCNEHNVAMIFTGRRHFRH